MYEHLTAAEMGYLAGLIDGEGCISIMSQGSKQRKSRRFALRVAIKMTHLGVLKYVQTLIGGSIQSEIESQNIRWKKQHRWIIARRSEVKALLTALAPYLIVKRGQAELALRFINLDERRCPSVRAEMHSRMLRLNQRGPVNETAFSPAPVLTLQ